MPLERDAERAVVTLLSWRRREAGAIRRVVRDASIDFYPVKNPGSNIVVSLNRNTLQIAWSESTGENIVATEDFLLGIRYALQEAEQILIERNGGRR